ncbi:MAG: adaptor protein MecA [Lachnospiraceae bacterium]|nr:adaptor protein MecA [Lachnospiraceae bacterium]
MKYKKINEATIQCIISEEDMEEYGLTIADIFERNEKGEGFLRDVVERAHDEVGYRLKGDNIAMQITPIRDEGLVITFSDAGIAGFQNMLEHIKEVLSGIDSESMRDAIRALAENDIPQKNNLEDTCRIFIFSSLNHVMRYCVSIPPNLTIRSHLYKEREYYYLVIEKNRLSKKNFNKISAQAVEFAGLIVPTEEKLIYLGEHGECMIKDRAVSRMRQIYQ